MVRRGRHLRGAGHPQGMPLHQAGFLPPQERRTPIFTGTTSSLTPVPRALLRMRAATPHVWIPAGAGMTEESKEWRAGGLSSK